MAFDPKSLVKNPAFAIGGGVVLGMGVFELIRATVSNVVQPWFNLVLKRGGFISITDDVALGCGPWIAAGIVGLVAVGAGLAMIKIASRD
jgi:hypothetical protein